MKNRTIYEVLDKTMENYSYSIKKTGNKVELKGSVVVPRIDIEVTHEKIFYYTQEDKKNLSNVGTTNELVLSKVIAGFKDELKEKVVSVIKEHKEELTDDEVMIEKLQYEIKFLKKSLSATEEELKKSKEEIAKLELEKISTQPYTPYPWINPMPCSTGITVCDSTGTEPGWMNYDISYRGFNDHTTTDNLDIYKRKNGEEI